MRLIINGTPGPVILHNGYRIPQAFGGSSFDPAFLWPERTVPRTEKPVRFVWRAPFGLCWGMVDKWAKLPRPFVA